MQRSLRKPVVACFLLEIVAFAAAAGLSGDRPVVLGLLAVAATCCLVATAVVDGRGRAARWLRHSAEAAARGDVSVSAEGVRRLGDLGRIANALDEIAERQRELAGVADAIGRGDLRAEVRPRGEHDMLGHAFDRMQQALRSSIGALEHQALYDALTGLPNRALLRDRMQLAIHATRRTQESCALLFMDLDRFKDVNDTLGHHHGDLLLIESAARMEGCLGEGDTLARLGGDEFAILVPGADGVQAKRVADRLKAALLEPFELEGTIVETSASIGVAVCPEHAEDVDVLIRHADVAMYQAKSAHSDFELYDPALDNNTPDRLAMVGDLRRAISGGQLQLYYQPQLDCQTRSVASVEALVRWNHPARGQIPPDEFIGLAEHTGLIAELTEWVLEAAIPQAAAWQDAGVPLTVAVNLSARNLRDSSLPAFIAGLLGQHGLRPARLLVEITESALLSDPDRALATLRSLRSLGVRVAVDDYGTGYSSLAYLKQLPLDELKIDRSFVTHMVTDPGDRSIVRSTIALAHELGLRVVAEGIEDMETLDLLAELGCDLAQGYLLSRPVPAHDLTVWLAHCPWAPARPRAVAA